MYVYKIINKINNKSYIGITSNIKERFKYHQTRYNKTAKPEYIEKPLYKAFRKYGLENFKFLVLYDNVSYEKAKELEVILIKKFKTLTHEWGYNVTKGGDCRSNYGANNNTVILTEEEAIDIKNRAARGETLNNIYKLYKDKVKKSTIQNICNGQSWKYLGSATRFMPSGASLNFEIVNKIKTYLSNGYTPKQIADTLGLEYRKVWRICKGKTYNNIQKCVEVIPVVGE